MKITNKIINKIVRYYEEYNVNPTVLIISRELFNILKKEVEYVAFKNRDKFQGLHIIETIKKNRIEIY